MNADGKGNRTYLPDSHATATWHLAGGIPTDMPAGQYEVLLDLPDPYPSLRGRPEYSIRLANGDTWEPSTGFNRLSQRLRVDPAATTPSYAGGARFTK